MGAVFDYKAWRHAGPAYGDLAVGDVTQLYVNGTLRDFIVVHQGNPDNSIYDSSCDGTWLMMKDAYGPRAWDSGSNSYANSDIHAYLSGTFLGLFSTAAQYAIKQVKIPYYAAGSYFVGYFVGSNGLDAKIFLLSNTELGSNLANSSISTEGVKLDYFDTTPSGKPLVQAGGLEVNHWLRSGRTPYSGYAVYVYGANNKTYGRVARTSTTNSLSTSYYFRPCLIMPSQQKIIE